MNRGSLRPEARGKFLFTGREKFLARGVTYGPFAPRAGDGCVYPPPSTVEGDFARMREAGVNSLRTYTLPPPWLLDLAHAHDLRVLAGISWPHHVAFLEDLRGAARVENEIRSGVRSCAGHPAILAFAVGNEIPASIVRWHGRRKIERFLERLYHAAKTEDPDALVSYVNFPSTEYLDLSFVDLLCFNVFLESKDRYAAYLSRLHSLAGNRPLVLSEIGLDSHRHGEREQARRLDWMIRSAFSSGAAGAFVFAWTDEWHRGGQEILDWRFGLTDRERRPKPALTATRRAFREAPFAPARDWPRMSVVVCTHNGARTLRDCLEGLRALEYPDFEVIVVADGCTDATLAICGEYSVRVIRTEHVGLSEARNIGWRAAQGEIVAYIDDDAHPDPHWLSYLAEAFRDSSHAGIGGPNIAPRGDGPIAEAVANAPGGPVHVLLAEELAEHIPGCNAAFRRSALETVGGFDPRFRKAGDDVDICWRLQERGWTLGFSPAAMVWHHRRNSVRQYWRQQVGYGEAEALLEKKWPEKYNAAGHYGWKGRLYGQGLSEPIRLRPRRIYQGVWGTAPFQAVYEPAAGTLAWLTLMPEWYLLVVALLGLTAMGALWQPLFLLGVPLAGSLALPLAQACISASRARFQAVPRSQWSRLGLRALTAALHLLQPAARLRGRLRGDLTPWRRRGEIRFAAPAPRKRWIWSERWRDSHERVGELEAAVRAAGAVIRRGGDCDDWDLQVRGGILGRARARVGVEEHGSGRQRIRYRFWPRLTPVVVAAVVVPAALAAGAWADGARAAAAILAAAAVAALARTVFECSLAMGGALRAVERLAELERAGAAIPREEIVARVEPPAPSDEPLPALPRSA